VKVIGMISGTSFDGIDVALVDLKESDGVISIKLIDFESVQYTKELRSKIAKAMPPQSVDMQIVCELDTQIGQAFADAASKILSRNNTQSDLIVSHGQTLYHWIENNKALGTLQLGEPTWIAQKIGAPVLSNIRSRDVAAGGHGAPLVSTLDQLMFGNSGSAVAALNLGGISNVTITGSGLIPIAYDIGPANGLLDAAILAHSNGQIAFDKDSETAKAGSVDRGVLAKLLNEPYYKLPAPKSTGKELFHLPYLLEYFGPVSSWQIANVMRTLLELTVETVAQEIEKFSVSQMYVHGGGTANPLMMSRLKERLVGVEVNPMSVLGLDPRHKEAVTFAVIGFMSWHGVPASVISCTGAASAEILGSITFGNKPLSLPEPKANRKYSAVIAN